MRKIIVLLLSIVLVIGTVFVAEAGRGFYSRSEHVSRKLPGGGYHSVHTYKSGHGYGGYHRRGNGLLTVAAVIGGLAIINSITRPQAPQYYEVAPRPSPVVYGSAPIVRRVIVRNETPVRVEVIMTYGEGPYQQIISLGFLESGSSLEMTPPVYDSRVWFSARARTTRGLESSIERWTYVSSYSRYNGKKEIVFDSRDWGASLVTDARVKYSRAPQIEEPPDWQFEEEESSKLSERERIKLKLGKLKSRMDKLDAREERAEDLGGYDP